MRYEHGFSEWINDDVRANYPEAVAEDGVTIDWTALHERDHSHPEPFVHQSDYDGRTA
jgi:hypothetical protein